MNQKDAPRACDFESPSGIVAFRSCFCSSFAKPRTRSSCGKMASSSAGGYSYYAAGSSLHGGPPSSFAEPVWIGIFRIGIRKEWSDKTKRRSRDALRQFFLESPEVPVRLNVTQSMHYGQCAVLTMFDLGTHEHGLDIMGEEFIPFGYLEGGSGQKRNLLPCRGDLVSS